MRKMSEPEHLLGWPGELCRSKGITMWLQIRKGRKKPPFHLKNDPRECLPWPKSLHWVKQWLQVCLKWLLHFPRKEKFVPSHSRAMKCIEIPGKDRKIWRQAIDVLHSMEKEKHFAFSCNWELLLNNFALPHPSALTHHSSHLRAKMNTKTVWKKQELGAAEQKKQQQKKGKLWLHPWSYVPMKTQQNVISSWWTREELCLLNHLYYKALWEQIVHGNTNASLTNNEQTLVHPVMAKISTDELLHCIYFPPAVLKTLFIPQLCLLQPWWCSTVRKLEQKRKERFGGTGEGEVISKGIIKM